MTLADSVHSTPSTNTSRFREAAAQRATSSNSPLVFPGARMLESRAHRRTAGPKKRATKAAADSVVDLYAAMAETQSPQDAPPPFRIRHCHRAEEPAWNQKRFSELTRNLIPSLAWRGPVKPRSSSGTAPSPEDAMGKPTDEQIRERAHQLWEQHGKPEGREDEFWRLAEQQLLNEDKSSPLRAPDDP